MWRRREQDEKTALILTPYTKKKKDAEYGKLRGTEGKGRYFCFLAAWN